MEIRIAVRIIPGSAQGGRVRLQKKSAQPDFALPAAPPQGKYRLGRKIGSGSFGDIYIGARARRERPARRAARPPAALAHAAAAALRRHAPPHRRGGRHQAGASRLLLAEINCRTLH
jgi:hypothetical protein